MSEEIKPISGKEIKINGNCFIGGMSFASQIALLLATKKENEDIIATDPKSEMGN